MQPRFITSKGLSLILLKKVKKYYLETIYIKNFSAGSY
jgi:hypothetical protein